MAKPTLLSTLSLTAVFCALIVICLGALTRLIDAGLGCPDWPGCYGQLTVPMSDVTREIAQLQFPKTPLVVYKAWAEMIHRYVVGALSFLILAVIGIIFTKKEYRTKKNIVLSVSVILLLIYQIMLGRWTITLKLMPIIVTQHLLGGFLILSVLWLIFLSSRSSKNITLGVNKTIFLMWVFAVLLLLCQISLGAWTSTNYASLSCPDFPFCFNNQTTSMQWRGAFNLSSPVGINYEGGILSDQIRQTIHMAHRMGALILTIYLFGLIVVSFKHFQPSSDLMKNCYLILGLVVIQICIGISNVIFKLPLITALAHTLVAVLLLLALITLTYRCWLDQRTAS